MAVVADQFRNSNPDRVRALVIPREHGAWGILLIPLVTGACVGLQQGNSLSGLMLFLTAALALFWMRTPLEGWLGLSPMRAHTASERRAVMNATLGVGAIAALALTALLWGGRNRDLLVIGCAAGTAFAAQYAVKLFGRKMRMPAQMIGAIGLTSTSVGAYYVVTGHIDSRAMAIWAANWLFACDQIHFVQLRLRNARLDGFAEKIGRGGNFFIGQLAMLVVIVWASGMGLLPIFAALAFIPAVARGIAWFAKGPKAVAVHWLGITELLHAITFGVLMISSFYIP
jgi:hypothetical protein